MGSGQWAVGSGQWAVGSGQWAVGSIKKTEFKIQYPVPSIQHPISVSLKVYDILGREVAILVNKKQGPGNYQVQFDGTGLSSGVYYYQLSTGNIQITKKCLLLK